MSLQDILMQRAALHFQNELDAPNSLVNLAQSIAVGIEEGRKRALEKEEERAKFKEAFGGGSDASSGSKLTGIIKSVSYEGGKTKIKYSTPTVSERKILSEQQETESFKNDVKAGIPAETLRVNYPLRTKEIDDLAIAGTIPIGSGKKPSSGMNIVRDGVEMEPEGLDALGRPTGYKPVKPTAAQDKRNVENTEVASQTKNILDLFVKSRKEATSVPGFGSGGITGRLANKAAIIKAKAGFSPAINVFQDRVAAFATTVAKAAGEVRPTDQDIVRFSKALTNLENNDAENAIQIEQILKDIQAKGQSVSWAKDLVKEFEKETGVPVIFNFGGSDEDISSRLKKYGLEQ